MPSTLEFSFANFVARALLALAFLFFTLPTLAVGNGHLRTVKLRTCSNSACIEVQSANASTSFISQNVDLQNITFKVAYTSGSSKTYHAKEAYFDDQAGRLYLRDVAELNLSDAIYSVTDAQLTAFAKGR